MKLYYVMYRALDVQQQRYLLMEMKETTYK